MSVEQEKFGWLKIAPFLDVVTEWARAQPDIQAVALIGSYARNAATASSDVDLVLIADQPDRFLRDRDWINHFGEPRRQQVEDYGRLVSLRVWYSDGREVEFGITDERWAATPLDEGTRRVISDGIQIIFERKPILSLHRSM